MGTKQPRSGMAILVLEDDEEYRRAFVRRYLRGRWWRVVEVRTVEEARAALREDVFGGALVDVRLPDGSGIELVVELLHEQPWVRVLVLTAFKDDRVASEAQRLGVELAIKGQEHVEAFLARLAIAEVVDERPLYDCLTAWATVNRLSPRRASIVAAFCAGWGYRDGPSRIGVGLNTFRECQRVLSDAGIGRLASIPDRMAHRVRRYRAAREDAQGPGKARASERPLDGRRPGRNGETAKRRNGETAKRRNGETAKRRMILQDRSRLFAP